MPDRITLPALQQMKRDRRKAVGVVIYDVQMALIVDRAGVDLVSVGDSVGVTMWGQRDALEVTLDQMRLVCRAVRLGVSRALLSCDMPYGPLQQGADAAVRAATLLAEDGADMVKLDAAAEYPDAVRAVVRAGIPVWAQFGDTPHGGARRDSGVADARFGRRRQPSGFVAQARLLEDVGGGAARFHALGPSRRTCRGRGGRYSRPRWTRRRAVARRPHPFGGQRHRLRRTRARRRR